MIESGTIFPARVTVKYVDHSGLIFVQNKLPYIVIYHVHVYTRQYAYADKCVSVRGSIRKFVKTKALSGSNFLPTLRGISGTA